VEEEEEAESTSTERRVLLEPSIKRKRRVVIS